MNVVALSKTTIRAPWVHIARTLWVLVALVSAAVCVIGAVDVLNESLPSCIAPSAACDIGGISAEDVAVAQQLNLPIPFLIVALFTSLVGRISLALVGLVIFLRRSDDWVALMLSGTLMTVLLEGTQFTGTFLNLLTVVVLTIGTVCFLPLPFLFPNGRCEPGWMQWFYPPVTFVYTVVLVATNFTPNLEVAYAIINLIWVIGAIYAMLYRYRHVSNAVERQQVKWVLVGIGVALANSIGYTLVSVFYPIKLPSPARIQALLIVLLLYPLAYGFFAAAIGIAMLRYRLWDIDTLIRRTLQYSLLTGLLAATYFAIVITLQRLIGSTQSQLITVISTLTIAVLFLPVRQRVQAFIDKRFYRRKYDAQQILAAFATYARDETDIERLTAQFASVVDETLQPEQVQVWIAQQGAK
jgi:hypothetical protein